MSVAVFDTHAFVKRLTAVGMPEALAEVLAEAYGMRTPSAVNAGRILNVRAVSAAPRAAVAPAANASRVD